MFSCLNAASYIFLDLEAEFLLRNEWKIMPGAGNTKVSQF